MSRVANDWAWGINIKPASLKLLLLAMADRADEYHCCYPSIKRLEVDTGLDKKTIASHISKLVEQGIIADTGERKGITKRVKVYRLVGISSGIDEIDIRSSSNAPENGGISNTPKNGAVDNLSNRSENGSLNTPKNGSLNRSENGSQNQSLEPPIEPSNKKYIKKDFDKDYLERAYLTFWQAGLNQTNAVQAEKLFHQLWQDLDKEPMEFAQFLREDIEKRLSLNQYGFDRLHPATYLKNKRWLDEYIVFRQGRKVSLTPLQLQIDSTQERLCQLQARRKSEQQSLELHERGGTASLVALDSFRNSIKNIDGQIADTMQRLTRLRTDNGGLS